MSNIIQLNPDAPVALSPEAAAQALRAKGAAKLRAIAELIEHGKVDHFVIGMVGNEGCMVESHSPAAQLFMMAALCNDYAMMSLRKTVSSA